MLSKENINSMKELYKSYRDLYYHSDISRESNEIKIIKLYNQTKKSKTWKELYKDDKSLLNIFDTQDNLKNIKIENEIKIFNYDEIKHIAFNLENIRNIKEEKEKTRNKKLDTFRNKLKEMIDNDFDYDFDIYHKYLDIKFEDSHHNYRKLTISKKQDYLFFESINENMSSPFDLWFSGNYCGCDVEETLSDDEIFEDDVDEIIDDSKINNSEEILMNDLKSEGPIYKFILENIDLIKNINISYKNINEIFHEKYDNHIENIFKSLTSNKFYELKYKSNFSFIIEKIDDNSYNIYKRIDNIIRKVENDFRLDSLKNLLIINIETKLEDDE